jgi:pyruvate,water dikinase
VQVLQSERKGKRILWFEGLGKEDIPLVGGKMQTWAICYGRRLACHLATPLLPKRITNLLQKTGIAEKIYKTIEQTVIDVDDPKQYEEASKRIRKLIESKPMPSEIAKEIKAAYSELDERIGMKDVFVAVRSSTTAEDLPDASFAGQQESARWKSSRHRIFNRPRLAFSGKCLHCSGET